MRNKGIKIILFIIIITLAISSIFILTSRSKIGKEIDSYKNVKVYYNGTNYAKSYGANYSKDGYLFGQKWQCVEFVKRFYYEAKNHKMPNVYGNARDFFDTALKQGELNKSRGLVQYQNGGAVKPEPDDLIVFNDTKYGHVAIVSKVTSDYIEIIQQNANIYTREKYKLIMKDNKYFVGTKRIPASFFGSIMGPARTNLMIDQLDGDTGAASSLMSFAFTFFGSIGMLLISTNFVSKIVLMGFMYLIIGLLSLVTWQVIYNKPFIKHIDHK